MKSKAPILIAAAMMMAATADYGSPSKGRSYEPTPPLSDKELKAIKEKQNTARGLKKFNIRGEEVWATNERTALKKYNKLFGTNC